MHATLSRFCQILLPVPFDQAYDYALPEGEPVPPLGSWVEVPFGRQRLIGVVWSCDAPSIAVDKIKPIGAVIAHVPPLSHAFRHYIDWVAAYNVQPRGAVLEMVLHAPALAASTTPARSMTKTPKPLPKASLLHQRPQLNADQQVAAQLLVQAVEKREFQPFLLDGVTGSGKTEVYFAAIEAVLAQGGQVLVLLPEIGLTVQWLARFEARFGVKPLLWHSSVTPAQKREVWREIAGINNQQSTIKNGTSLVVGARSALFLPFADLRLIIVDEEHDGSYKQEEGVMYHARDMAVARAKQETLPIVLASATPSLETWLNAQERRYHLLSLPDRHGGAMAPVRALDMRQAGLSSRCFIAPFLVEKIKETVGRGEQAALFLNRRGYAPLVLCRGCGHRFTCRNCSSWMVLHEDKALVCHHCQHREKVPTYCPQCMKEGPFAICGPGVERLQEEVQSRIPGIKVGVMTSDALTTPKQLQAFIQAVASGEIALIIGTQMMAKGHHFPKLTLVGVVDADMGLNVADPRAAEQCFQLLHQVAGRAGRAAHAGEVWLQTSQPDHPVMQALVRQDRGYFIRLETELREAAGLPPFGRLAAVVVSGEKEEEVWAAARTLAREAPVQQGVQLLGPAAAPLYRLRRHVRVRFLLKSARNTLLQPYLRRWLANAVVSRGVRVKVDVDPLQFM